VLDCLSNLLKRAARIPKNLMIPETEDAKAVVSVLTSIRLNDKHLFERDEVNNPGSDGNLSAEFCACKLP